MPEQRAREAPATVAKAAGDGAVKKDDGTLEAGRVNVGRDGITPPM